jgi:eukaryotic-like serine/threonine-protein kinase
MSFWRRLFGKDEARSPEPGPEAVVPPPAEPPPPDPKRAHDLARLERVGRPDGIDLDEAMALLRSLHGSAEQTAVLGALLDGLGDEPVYEPLRVACAALLESSGLRAEALAVLEPARGVPALLLAAEICAAQGNLARALGYVERVLARDIDAPGARERHERWSQALGRVRPERVAEAGATVVAPAMKKTPYRLLREVARGGAGAVYEAEDELLGRRLAFKVYHRAERDRVQVQREARLAVELRGPGVLRVYDADPEAGWLATEWATRGSLRDILKGGRVAEVLPVRGWLGALVHAVERVHAAGLVHADLKPSNVLFRRPDDPLLGDFGTACRAGEPGLGGTVSYLSPERLDGAPAHPRDDVYAVGRLLEDVLAARDETELPADVRAATEEDARRCARVALACLAGSDARPANATALGALLCEG